MIFRKSGLLSGLNWERFQNYAVLSGFPSQLPMSYAPGRVVQVFNMSGTGFGLSGTTKMGLAVFDFSDTKNKYVLTRFSEISEVDLGHYWYSIRAMVDDETLIVIRDDSSLNDVANRAVVSINADGEATLIQAYTNAGNMNCSVLQSFQSSMPVGHDGNLYYGYTQASSGPFGTTNGWVDKVTTATYTAMSDALQAGYTGGESTQDSPGQKLAMLGYDSPNGFLVVLAGRDDHETTVRYRLVDATGTPSVGVECSWAGKTGNYPQAIPISPVKVIVGYQTTAGEAKMALLYTNSTTTPTTLTKGAECSIPSIPTGAGFDAGDVDFSYFEQVCVNYKAKESKVLVWCVWKLSSTSDLADGNSNYYVHAPCVIESTSNSNITAAIPTEDVWGNAPILLYDTSLYEYYSITTVGAPDSKAVNWWINPGETTLNQQTFQL